MRRRPLRVLGVVALSAACGRNASTAPAPAGESADGAVQPGQTHPSSEGGANGASRGDASTARVGDASAGPRGDANGAPIGDADAYPGRDAIGVPLGDANGAAASTSGVDGGPSGGTCAVVPSRVRITEIDVGARYLYNEVDSNGGSLGLTPLALSPIPGGGSRLAWMGGDAMVHVALLDETDQFVAGSAFGLPAYDFQDIFADRGGGVVLVTRPAQGAGTTHCGNIANLCGEAANYPTGDGCYDMYLVRFDGATESWAAKLTDSSPTNPPYMTGPTAMGSTVYVWWYAHNGRIAFDGANYGAYFGAAVSVSQTCVQPSTLSTGVNVHEGDRLSVVGSGGAVQSGGFGWGCSHSGYERLTWDSAARRFVAVCKNDLPAGSASGRIALAPDFQRSTIYAVDLSYSDLGAVIPAGGGGDWVITSNVRPGEPANAAGRADIHLLHFMPAAQGATADRDIVLASDAGLNDRAPHLAAYGGSRMLAAWEVSSKTGDLVQGDATRRMLVQALDLATGAAEGAPLDVTALPGGVTGSRYQDFRSFPDGSVAYAAPGSSATQIRILRVLPCP